MSGWQAAKLREVTQSIARGVAPAYTENGGILVVNQRCVRNHQIDFAFARRHDPSKKSFNADRLIKVGDVLVNSTGVGTLGRVAQVRGEPPEPTTVDTHVTIMRPTCDLFYSDFFGYMLVAIEAELAEAGEGASGQTELSRTRIGDFEVRYPKSIAEQKRIVAILDEAFEGIAKATANAERNLANARELPDALLDNILLSQAEDWSRKRLGEIADFKNGLNFTRTSRGEMVKIVGVKDFRNEYWVPSTDLESVTIDGELPVAYELRPGDILTVRSNGNKNLIGRCIIAADVPEKTSHSGFTIRIRVSDERVSPEFLAFLLKSRRARAQLVASGGGANITSLNQQALTELEVAFPPLSEQRRLREAIEALMMRSCQLAEIAQTKLTDLADLKSSLLQRAFSGQLTGTEAIAA